VDEAALRLACAIAPYRPIPRAAEGLLTHPIQGHRELRKPAYRGLAREPALVGGRPCGPDAQPVSLGTSRHLVIRDPDRMYVEFIQQ